MKPTSIPVQVKRLTETAIVPVYGSALAAGFDLHADLKEPWRIAPGGRATIPTGIAIALPAHLAVLISPRSGLSAKSGITVHNGPGVIDADYRGGMGVILHNTTDESFIVTPGDRIAQGVIVPVFQAAFEEVEELPETGRGAGGFGSTGQSRTPIDAISQPPAEAIVTAETVGQLMDMIKAPPAIDPDLRRAVADRRWK